MSDHTRARLVVQSAQGQHEFDQDRVVVGREQTCDVVVADPRASRHHLTFERQGDAWFVADSSTGGTFVGGARVSRLPVGPAATSYTLGDPHGETVVAWLVAPVRPAPVPPPYQPAQHGGPAQPAGPPPHRSAPPPYQPTPPPLGDAPVVAQAVLPPGQLEHGRTMMPASAGFGRSVTIGRDLSNDIVLDDPLASRFHARLELGQQPGAAMLHDLGSFNGVFVNGQRVAGSVRVDPGSEVIVGNQTFRWDGTQLLTSATQHEFTLYVDGLSVVVGGGKRLLENVSFTLAPSSLTAVIGPSGAGKSTLLGALTGLRPATHGRVIWQGHDLYAHYDQLRFQIGLVPQQDIQHPQLKVRQALGYAAELRLPPDTRPEERAHRVHTVAGQLQLQQRLDNRIGTELSGGQKKRVSIATELLTAPPLLFLDEPTSGLDPGLDLEVMRQLRSLADDGRVVVVVTHSVLALDVCDNVMVLAPGGRIAYFGPPAGVLAHFGVSNYPEVFDLLDEPDLWSRITPPRSSTDTGRLPAPAAPVPAPPRQSITRQLSTMVRRNTAVVVADRLLLSMLVALPLVLGGLSRLVPGGSGLSLDDTRRCPPNSDAVGPLRCQPTQDGQPFGDLVDKLLSPGEASQRLIVLIVAACLMGTAIAIRELVGERPIFRREYAVGLSPGVYFASKIVVLGSAAFLQGLVVTFIAVVGLPGADGELGTARIALTIGALSFTMAVVGLCLSALVTSTEQTMPALVGMIMVQLVLSGSLFAINRPVLEQISWLSPSRWAYAACASSMGLTRAQGEREKEDWIARAGGAHFVMDVLMLGLLGTIAVGIGFWLVRRSATSDG
ncbi:ATP-binding cassette domain-containing protein [Nocardioides sp. 1609]|uniref:FHA domain-containing protein n=1 Tax=Nocardioides sp. 1609 TaxID=2508327 RepID=UPI0010700360|nr:ATP-binding cassette domain-containing protein [Nocardioides sp. 1609]